MGLVFFVVVLKLEKVCVKTFLGGNALKWLNMELVEWLWLKSIQLEDKFEILEEATEDCLL